MTLKIYIAKQTLAVMLIIAGGCTIWLWPIPAILMLCAGVCTLQSFWKLLKLPMLLQWGLPVLLLILCALSLLLYRSTPTVTAFPERNEIPDTVYVTESGTKYHYSKKCAGKNATAWSMELAKSEQYKPCGSCCKTR